MAHQTLHCVDRHALCQQKDAEGMPSAVEIDGFLYSGVLAPATDKVVRPWVADIFEDAFAFSAYAAKYFFGSIAKTILS